MEKKKCCICGEKVEKTVVHEDKNLFGEMISRHYCEECHGQIKATWHHTNERGKQ